MIHPLGNKGYDFVKKGNLLLCRVALLILVASYRGARWLLEQPHGSCLSDHPRWDWLMTRISESGCVLSTVYSVLVAYKYAMPAASVLLLSYSSEILAI